MYLLVNIGCIECGVSSQIVGLFETKDAADKAAEKCYKNYSWREGGQNGFEVFPLPEVGAVHPEYDL